MKFLKTILIATNFLYSALANTTIIERPNLRGIRNLQDSKDIIKGINWFGFETEYKNLMCSWAHSIEWNLQTMRNIGFNYIRLPFSEEFVKEGNWMHMDEFFEKSQQFDMKVVLDFHRLHSTHQSFQPYDEEFTFDEFLYSWKTILDRYKHYPNLVAVDIFNEYQGSNYVEWNNLARQIVNFIESNFPGRFDYMVGGTNWGGNIHYMDLSDLPFSDRIRYSVHKYWFSDAEPYEEKWNYSFGDHTPVVNVGEWGYKSDEAEEVKWAKDFVDYLIDHDLRDTFFWTWSWNSGDTGGILLENCESIDYEKMNLLNILWNS